MHDATEESFGFEADHERDHDWHEFEPIDGDPYHERCACGLMRSVIDLNNAEFA